MENVYRFKKRMVYPEKLALDQVAPRTASKSASSWCSEPNKTIINVVEKKDDTRKSTSPENSANMGANKQFIQDRIRHLVDAFTLRAQTVKERIQMPPTPSSISSRETLDEPAVDAEAVKTKLTNPQDTDTKSEEIELSNKTFCSKIRHVYDTKVIDPQGKVYVFWMSIAASAVLYNTWVIPLRCSFPYQTPENTAIWMAADYLADFIYIVDMLLIQPRIMFLSEGFWMKDFNFTRQNYMRKTRFKMDLLSILPLDFFYFLWGPQKVILRIPRIIKMHTFWDFFDLVDKLIASPHILRITRTLLYMMYLIHLNACAYYGFSAWEGIGSNNFVFNGEGNAYIKCFYFATKTATSIGKNPKPTQELEYLFMTFSWLMGVFVFALLIGQIRDIIATATRSQTEYRKLVDETLEYLRRLNLPQDMQRRAQLWFHYTWETQHTLDENTIMDCLPHKMKTDVSINVHIQTLSKVKLFADCDEALLRELVLQLKSVIYLPGDIICKRGDVGKEMYIIQSGKVQVLGKCENEVLATLSEGCVFGEISLLGIAGMNRRTADVRSYGYSNLFVLSKADLNAALSHYPEAQDLLNKKAKQLMKKNAALERKRNALIVINNPVPRKPQAKLIDTVLQVLPADSETRKLLRFGSRIGHSKPQNDKFKVRNSLPSVMDINYYNNCLNNSFETSVTVHRSMS
ncbi:cyclic nucleotide-gated channel beta-1-like [Onthophagus taurus]|uniref:cyclic nucleotide-gated channel beta-1-like n=1 Tax=Onthophagus taurus TaxID=166361 RepID=UPI000C20EEC0|nr:cyclic nucleotide-gated cation channel beta-1-like [Onthophagus taurus]